jgi:hypothetical protein
MPVIRLAATLALGFALVGCKAVSALSTQEVIVHFTPNAVESDHVRVAQTCGGLPHTTAQPIPKHENAGQALTDVHFLVNPGSGKNLNTLYACLGRFPGVVLGYDTPDM